MLTWWLKNHNYSAVMDYVDKVKEKQKKKRKELYQQ